VSQGDPRDQQQNPHNPNIGESSIVFKGDDEQWKTLKKKPEKGVILLRNSHNVCNFVINFP